MKITLLGTGTSQGVPVIACPCEVCQSKDPKDNRLRSSILVEEGPTTFIIDTGPDFREQMLRHNVLQLDGVVFTHAHRDHTAGLDDVRAFNFIQQKEMDIYIDDIAFKTVETQYDYIFAPNPYPGAPKVIVNKISDQPFSVNGIELQPINVMHYKLPVKGFRMGDFTYITDANYIAPEEKEKIKGTKILVLNTLRQKEHISHFTLQEGIELAQELQPQHTYFTHISHQMGLHETINAQLPKGMELAYDGLQFEV